MGSEGVIVHMHRLKNLLFPKIIWLDFQGRTVRNRVRFSGAAAREATKILEHYFRNPDIWSVSNLPRSKFRLILDFQGGLATQLLCSCHKRTVFLS